MFSIEYQHTTPVEHCKALFPMQGTQTASLDTSKSPVYVSLIVAFVEQFHLATSLEYLTRSPEK